MKQVSMNEAKNFYLNGYNKERANWFGDGEMNYFNTILPDHAYHDKCIDIDIYFFISGSRMDETRPVQYQVHRIDTKEGYTNIETIFDYKRFDSYEEALEALNYRVQAHPDCVQKFKNILNESK